MGEINSAKYVPAMASGDSPVCLDFGVLQVFSNPDFRGDKGAEEGGEEEEEEG